MQLELGSLKNDHCPDCHARWVRAGFQTGTDGQIMQHVMGGEWQFVEYTCGRRDEFSPNFDSVVQRSKCSNTPEAKAEEKRKHDAKKKLQGIIGNMGLKDSEVQDLNRALSSTFGWR